MAYRYYIDQTVNCVFIQHYGTYELSEATRQAKELLEDPIYRKNMNLLRDVTQTSLPDCYDLGWFRNFTQVNMEENDVKLGSERRVAWVLGNPNDFKIIHQWCAVGRLNAKVEDRQPFRDVARAMEWLGIPKDYEITYP